MAPGFFFVSWPLFEALARFRLSGLKGGHRRCRDRLFTMTQSDLKSNTGWQQSLWASTATRAPECPALKSAIDTEVAIVGAGFTGLSAALHLAESGKIVHVFDRYGPGWGCSGRNGGQVNPAWKLLPEAVEEKFGEEAGRRAVMLANDACDLVFELVSKHGIDCDAIRPGYVQGAYNGQRLSFLREWVRQWSERGVDVRELDGESMYDVLGTRRYSHGMIDARGGSVQPLSYARGLARAAIAAGATIHGETAVEGASHDGGDWILQTPAGEVRARHVLWCTNGYTDNGWTGLKQTVVPVTSFVVASDPLSSTQRRSILPGGHAVSETANIQLYYRLDSAGRMVMGGRGNRLHTRLEGNTGWLEQQAVKLFPELEGIEWQFRWGGHPAMTKDKMPRLMKLDENAWSAMGYNGRGVAMATMMGRELAHCVNGGETAYPVSSLARIPFHACRQLGISWHLITGGLIDRVNKA